MTHPPFDVELMAAVQDAPPSLTTETLHDRREQNGARTPDIVRPGRTVDTFEIPRGDGTAVSGCVVAPRSGGSGAGILFLHGGGLVMGNDRQIDPTVLDLVDTAGVMVISVDYRLAPEHPYPAGLEDSYAGLVWAFENAARWGVDPRRLGIVGSSAGGGLAAAIAIVARERGGPTASFQALYAPMLDDRGITASSQELVGEGRWDSVSNRTAWAAYLGPRAATDDVPASAAPARALDLSGLPPAYIDVGDADTFRDEDVEYAMRLARAGVPVELHVWPGGFHGFANSVPDATLSRAARRARVEFLERALRRP